MDPPTSPPELPVLLPPDARRSLWMRALCLLGALVCFVLGVVGWLIPVVPGLPFYAAGLVLLGMANNRVAGWVNRLEQRLPHKWRVKIREWTARATKKR